MGPQRLWSRRHLGSMGLHTSGCVCLQAEWLAHVHAVVHRLPSDTSILVCSCTLVPAAVRRSASISCHISLDVYSGPCLSCTCPCGSLCQCPFRSAFVSASISTSVPSLYPSMHLCLYPSLHLSLNLFLHRIRRPFSLAVRRFVSTSPPQFRSAIRCCGVPLSLRGHHR